MKVYDITGLNTVGKIRQQTKGSLSEADFRTLLAAEMTAASGPAGLGETAAVRPANPAVSAAVRLEGLSISENILGLLDNYAEALDNPAFKGEDLEPFIASLEENTGGLLAVKGQLSADDPLTGVLERVAAVSFLESAKFRRGDYSS